MELSGMELDEYVCASCGGHNTEVVSDYEERLDNAVERMFFCYTCDRGYINVYHLTEQVMAMSED